MENARGDGGFLRNRRFESFLSTSSGKRVGETPKVIAKNGSSEQRAGGMDVVFVDDDDG